MKSVGVLCLAVATTLVGCASSEFRATRDLCTIEADVKFPRVFEERVVNKTRSVQVPDGTTSCVATGSYSMRTMNCTENMRTDYVPYTAVERFDVNKDARRAAIKSCTYEICLRDYGNARCKVAE